MTKRRYLSSLMRLMRLMQWTRAGLLVGASLAIWVALSQLAFAQVDPVVINLQSGATPTQHAFGHSASDDVIHYYWTPSDRWKAENLTQRPNIGNAFRIQHALKVINGPTSDAGVLTQHVFGRNSSAHLIHYYWTVKQGWAAENTDYFNIGQDLRMFN